jgi:hypothetical protein
VIITAAVSSRAAGHAMSSSMDTPGESKSGLRVKEYHLVPHS